MADRSKEANQNRVQFWKYHIDTWSRSGLSQTAYCRANNLKSHRLTYWKNKFKKQKFPVEFVQISPAQISESCHSQPRQSLRLNIESGFQIEIPDGFSNTTLMQVLQIIRQFWCSAVARSLTRLRNRGLMILNPGREWLGQGNAPVKIYKDRGWNWKTGISWGYGHDWKMGKDILSMSLHVPSLLFVCAVPIPIKFILNSKWIQINSL